MQDVLYAIQRRRDEVLSITGCTVTQSLINASPGRTTLDDTAIDIRRIYWLPTADPTGDFIGGPMWSDDQFGVSSFNRGFTTNGNGTPTVYMQSAELPLSFDVDADPAINGQYDVVTINAGLALSTQFPNLINIPDDFFWVIKWGALADLFALEPNSKDVLRQQYCEMRYRQGIAALFIAPSVLYARVNNVPVDVDSVQNMDDFRAGWEVETPGEPTTIGTLGLNLIAAGSPPDDVYSVTLGVVQNIPVPMSDAEFVQVSRDDLEAILDYAQHLAMLKIGGQEFSATIPLLDRFHKKAAAYNKKLNELGEYTKPMYEASQLQAENNPVFESDPTV
jgi:hypothetical protein